jgi:hypothetical protein
MVEAFRPRLAMQLGSGRVQVEQAAAGGTMGYSYRFISRRRRVALWVIHMLVQASYVSAGGEQQLVRARCPKPPAVHPTGTRLPPAAALPSGLWRPAGDQGGQLSAHSRVQASQR